jgi:hypothetical protein
MEQRPPVREMIREAIRAQGGSATNDEIRHYIRDRYGDVKESTIAAQTALCTVNAPSRVNFPNVRPRLTNDSRYDILYRVDRGRVELYDPAKHGTWEITRTEAGGSPFSGRKSQRSGTS